jgi:hypothetical protein
MDALGTMLGRYQRPGRCPRRTSDDVRPVDRPAQSIDAWVMSRAVTLLLGSLLLLACQPAPANLLTDPVTILQAAATATASAKSVHIDATADGPIEVDPLGTGAGAAINLKGTTGTVDADLSANELHASFLSPNLLNLSAEVITLDGKTYLKSSLTGSKFQVSSTPTGSIPSAVPSASSSQALAGLSQLLARPDIKPVKGDDAPCAGGTCYTVTLQLTAAQLQSILGSSPSSGASGSPAPTASGGGPTGGLGVLPGLGGQLSGLPLPDLSTATADLTVRVEQSTNRLSGIDAKLHLGDMGDPTIQLTFTKWDQPVSIQAPPADQVQPTG